MDTSDAPLSRDTPPQPPPHSPPTPQGSNNDDDDDNSNNYTRHRATLRSIIEVDHFSGTVPPSLVDLWLDAIDPSRPAIPLPASIRGFYGGDLRASIPIELAHDSYKYVLHEPDRGRVERYCGRMLVALSVLDLGALEASDANLAGLAYWHKGLALARLGGEAGQMGEVLRRYGEVRERATLSDGKLPQLDRLRGRLLGAAREAGVDGEMVKLLEGEALDVPETQPG